MTAIEEAEKFADEYVKTFEVSIDVFDKKDMAHEAFIMGYLEACKKYNWGINEHRGD